MLWESSEKVRQNFPKFYILPLPPGENPRSRYAPGFHNNFCRLFSWVSCNKNDSNNFFNFVLCSINALFDVLFFLVYERNLHRMDISIIIELKKDRLT